MDPAGPLSLYSPEWVEGLFSEVRRDVVLRSRRVSLSLRGGLTAPVLYSTASVATSP
jgi:hypothetical protein